MLSLLQLMPPPYLQHPWSRLYVSLTPAALLAKLDVFAWADSAKSRSRE
jgi:hypothetical protein